MEMDLNKDNLCNEIDSIYRKMESLEEQLYDLHNELIVLESLREKLDRKTETYVEFLNRMNEL